MADGRISANKNRSKISDAELIEACKTMTINEIAEKYGMHHSQIRRRCRINGWKPVGYGDPNYRSIIMSAVNASGQGNRQGNYIKIFGECWHYISSQDKMCKVKHPAFEYIETRSVNGSSRVRLRCRTCKMIIERAASSVREKGIECEFCKEQEKHKEKLKEERVRLMRFFNALVESKKPKECAICGNIFYSEYAQAVYCSDRCRRKAKKDRRKQRDPLWYKELKKTRKHISRAKKYGVPYVHGITLKAVAKRDNNICQICGKTCDWNDDSWGNGAGPNYPSIDHIIPLSRGGSHTWDNVQCAHAICNSYKRDLIHYG